MEVGIERRSTTSSTTASGRRESAEWPVSRRAILNIGQRSWRGSTEWSTPASWVFFANRVANRVAAASLTLADTANDVANAFEQSGAATVPDNVRIAFCQSDGFDLVASAEDPTLVFVDPPYKDKRDWRRLIETCSDLRNRAIPFLAWYPYFWHSQPDRIIRVTRCDAWEVLWATCGAKPSQNLKGCGMLVSDDISVVLRDSLAAFEILPASAGNSEFEGGLKVPCETT